MQVKHMNLLGLKVRDKVTGFEGVVSTISFDLYGCIQAVLTPPLDKEGKKQEGCWFDVARLTIIDDRPVMEVPDFTEGPTADGKQIVDAIDDGMCHLPNKAVAEEYRILLEKANAIEEAAERSAYPLAGCGEFFLSDPVQGDADHAVVNGFESMEGYLGETVVTDLAGTDFESHDEKEWAVEWMSRYGQIDDGNHRLWVIDQVMRILNGTPVVVKQAKWENGKTEFRLSLGEPSVMYKAFVQDYEAGGEHEWETGSVPQSH